MNATLETTINTIELIALVDRLAILKTMIDGYVTEQNQIKAKLVASGLPVINGTMHRVAVSHCDGKVTTDWRTIAAKFEPSRQLISAHTTQGEGYDVVRLSGRKGA